MIADECSWNWCVPLLGWRIINLLYVILYNLFLSDTRDWHPKRAWKRGIEDGKDKMEGAWVSETLLGGDSPAALEYWYCNLHKQDIYFSWVWVFGHFVTAAKINWYTWVCQNYSLALNFLFYKMKEFATLASLLFPKHIEHSGLPRLLFPRLENSFLRNSHGLHSLLSSA